MQEQLDDGPPPPPSRSNWESSILSGPQWRCGLSRELEHVAKEPARRGGVVRDDIVRAVMGSMMAELCQKGHDTECDCGGCAVGCHGGDSF